jgi:hypothetical protein
MKKCVLDFMRRGLIACGFGPLVLAILYLIIYRESGMGILTVEQVCKGIFSISALAFIVGGMNILYQIERLPLTVAILIHGGVLYISYLATYLINGWLEVGMKSVLVYSGIFISGYLLIWIIIFLITKKNTEKVNEKLKQRREKLKEI